jgi:hypothetical protein
MDPQSLLDVARDLAKPTAKGAWKEARIRRSISTAYYAAFNALQHHVANAFVGKLRYGTPTFARVFRSIDHKTVRTICNRIADKGKGQTVAKDLGVEFLEPELISFAESFIALHEAREKADYAPSKTRLSWSHAHEMIAYAETVVSVLENSKLDVLTAFAVLICFKER